MEHKKIERLMLFGEVARQLSFTKAADVLGISRGYLSSQIKQLEREMEMSLLIRSTRNVRLTANGIKVQQSIESIKQTLLSLEREVDSFSESLNGSIRITAPLQFTQAILVDLCQDFRQLHPEVNFEVECSYTSHDLEKDNFDLAFRATVSPPDNMIAKHLMNYSHIVVGAPTYLACSPSIIEPNDLKSHQRLTWLSHDEWDFTTGTISGDAWLKIDNNILLKQRALKGEGLLRVPEYFVEQELESGALVEVLQPFKKSHNSIYLLYPQLMKRAKRIVTFIEFVSQRMNVTNKPLSSGS